MCSLWIVYYKHKFIIAIHFFLSLDLFWINSPLNDIKYQLCYLKWCLYTQKFYLFIVTSFFYLLFLVLFLCLLKIVYYNKFIYTFSINEFVVFLCIVHLWFWFFYPFTQIFSIGHKGTIVSQSKNSVSECIFFSYKNVASKPFHKSEIHPFPLMIMQRNEMWYTYTPLGI
jgi:hypothetical protein